MTEKGKEEYDVFSGEEKGVAKWEKKGGGREAEIEGRAEIVEILILG